MNIFTTRNIFLLYAATFGLSFLGHVVPFLNPLLFTLYLLLFTVLTFRRLEYGFYLLFADLFVDSFGYVFAWNWVSVRMAMAGVLVALIGIRLIRLYSQSTVVNQESKTPSLSPPLTRGGIGGWVLAWIRMVIGPYRTLWVVYLILISWLFFSFIHGWIANGFQNAFQDFNGLLFLLFLPMVVALPAFGRGAINRAPTGLDIKKIITILKAALFWQFALASSIELIFSRFGVVPVLYTFIRDNRFGEITPAFGNFFRIFLQSEVYAVVGLLLALIGIFYSVIPAKAGIQTPKINTKRSFGFLFSFLDPESRFRMTNIGNYLLLFISVTILLINLSRSFWLGTGVGIITLSFLLLCHSVLDTESRNKQPKQKEFSPFGFLFSFLDPESRFRMTVKKVFVIGAVTIVSLIYVAFISNTGFQTQQVVNDRITISEPAASSRAAQLEPLNSAIVRSPIVGYGFGKELEYRSSDPRRLVQSGGTGIVKTWAFELGWHDLALKTGYIGGFLYLSFILLLMRQLLKIPNHKRQITNKSQITSAKSQTDWGFSNWNLFGIYNLEFGIYRLTMLLSLLALIAIHVFTPYLNHPLGIGILLLAFIGVQKNAVDSSDRDVVW